MLITFLDLLQVVDELFELQSIVCYLAVPNFKQANDTMIIQEEILINSVLDLIESNLGLLENVEVASLNKWMSFEVDLNVGKRLILLLDFIGVVA